MVKPIIKSDEQITEYNDNFLVSVVVVTYNSAKYILETLESIKNQTYEKIELIITDDNSQDKTLEICTKWINANQSIFVRCKIIRSSVNTGIPANCNRGLNNAHGRWLKFVAGDDVLHKDCVKNIVDYVTFNPDCSILSFSIQFFEQELKEDKFGIRILPENYVFFYSRITSEQQYNILLRRDYVWSSGMALRRSAIIQVGGFDEKYRWIEDWPILLKLSKAGFKIYGSNKLAVYYRRHNTSVLHDPINKIYTDFYIKARPFYKDYLYPEIPILERASNNLEHFRKRLFDLLGLNRNTRFCIWLFKFTSRFNPSRYILDRALQKALNNVIVEKPV